MFRYRFSHLPRHRLFWIAVRMIFVSVCLFLFLRLSVELIKSQSFPFDQKVIDLIERYHSPAMDRMMTTITELGSVFILGLLLFFTMIWFVVKRKDVWGMLIAFLAVAGGGMMNLFLKDYFSRERPVNAMVEVSGLSFPSGHSMGSMTYFGLLAYLVFRSKQKSLKKTLWIVGLGLVILTIGLSRIYLGVHYPSDVLAGFLAGIVWLMLCISILEFVYFLKEEKRLEK